jgi:phospholipase/carboxylesterase
MQLRRAGTDGRFAARPRSLATTLPAGVHEVRGPADRPALVAVPRHPNPAEPLPLAVLLHDAGGTPAAMLESLHASAAVLGIVLALPASAGATWDLFDAGLGTDVTAIDRLLGTLFGRVAVDPTRIAFGGFGDGASYALSVGLANGDLFTHLVALAPARHTPVGVVGRPRIFVAHGLEDATAPIARTSRRIVPALRRGYPVEYEEHPGGHALDEPLARRSLAWLVEGRHRSGLGG